MDEELKALRSAFEEKLKMAASKPELETLKAELSEQIKSIVPSVSKEELETIKSEFNEKLKAQWSEVEKKLNEGIATDKPLTFGEQLKAAFEKSGLIEVTEIEGRRIESVKFDASNKSAREHIKLAVDMNTANTTASVEAGYQTNYGMTPEKLPLTRDEQLTDVFPHTPMLPIETHFAKVVEYTEVDGSAIKTETSAAGDSSFLLKTETFLAFGFGVKFRVHRNILRTWQGLQARIQTIGMDRLKSKISSFILDSGAAGDGSTVPYGIGSTSKYTAYDLTNEEGTVQAANIVDVIGNAILQVDLLEKDVDTIMLNPVDIAKIKRLKDSDNNILLNAGLVMDQRGNVAYLHGLRIVKTKKVTKNTFWMVNAGSNPSVEIGDKFDLEVMIGYDKDQDFSKGVVTIQLEQNLAIGIGDPETIIYCSDIATAASRLNAPSN